MVTGVWCRVSGVGFAVLVRCRASGRAAGDEKLRLQLLRAVSLHLFFGILG